MTITHNFEVTKMTRDASTDVVKTIDWKYTATDDADGVSIFETGKGMRLESITPSDSGFIAYASLTKAKVKEWWTALMNKNFHTIDELHTGMELRIKKARIITEKTDLPW